jgi:hypothetical protein
VGALFKKIVLRRKRAPFRSAAASAFKGHAINQEAMAKSRAINAPMKNLGMFICRVFVNLNSRKFSRTNLNYKS